MHKILLKLELELGSRWHAGAGEGSLTVDRIVRRDSAMKPYIPASTLKGVVRESCERLSRTLQFPVPQDPHSSNLRDLAVFGPLKELESPIDSLFGSKYEGGDLFFRDARFAQEDDAGDMLEFSQTSMYRGLRTVREHHLFTSEFAGACRFATSITGFHRHLLSCGPKDIPFAYCLLVAGLLAVTGIGSNKSTGSGALRVHVTKVLYNDREFAPDAVFEYLSDQDLYEISLEEAKKSL